MQREQGLTIWASTDSTNDASPEQDAGGAEEGGAFRALGTSPDAPRLLVFAASGRVCACELTSVREIIPFRQATRLPGAPPFVTGLINLRGTIVTVIDLGVRLGGSPTDPERGSIVLVEAGTRVLGVAVDELRDVQRVARTSIEPASSDPANDGLVRGALESDGVVVALLDVDRLVTHTLA